MIDRKARVAVAFVWAMGIAGTAAAGEPLATSNDPPAPGSEPVLITLAGANQLVISHAASAKTDRFALVVIPAPKVDVARLEASVLAITRDGSIQATVPTAVSAALEAGGGVPVLRLGVDFTRLFVPGSYEVTIVVAPRPAAAAGAGSGAAPAGPPASGRPSPPGDAGSSDRDRSSQLGPQRLIVRLIVPAATLRPIASVLVEREIPLLGEPRGAGATITFRETSNTSPVSLSASQEGPLLADDRVVGGQLVLRDLAPIDPGMAGTATLAFEGEFPVGTTRGNLLVTARELAAPILVPIEVRSRRPGWLVPVLFLFGAGLGGLWRTVLANRRTALAAELATNALRDRVTAVIEAQPEDWALDLLELRGQLDGLRADDPATATATCAALDAVLACRATRIAELGKVIQAGLVATRTVWRLPLGLDLVDAATHYGTAYARLQRRAFSDAIASAQRGATATDAVLDRCRTWCSALARFVAPLAECVPGCPGPARTGVRQAVEHLITALDAAEEAMACARPALDQLQAMHAAARAAVELAKALAEALDQLWRTTPATLDPTIAARMRSAATLPSRPSERPEEAIQDGVAACAALAEVAAAAVRETYGTEAPERVTALAEGRYVDALTAGAAPEPAPRAALGRGGTVSAREATPIVATIVAPVRREAPGPVATAVVVALDAARPDPPRSARRIHAELDGVTVVRWAIGAVVTSAAAWVLYGAAFMGTHLECFAVFAAGFLTDLTTDTAIDAILGRLKPPEPPVAAPPVAT
jgi:hypothetical protein